MRAPRPTDATRGAASGAGRAAPDGFAGSSPRWPTVHESYVFPLVEKLLSAEGSGLRVLDLGCGDGSLTHRLARAGHDAIGLDLPGEGLDAAREAESGARFHEGSVYDADFPARVGAPVDCVVSLEVIEHLLYPRRLLDAARATLRPGGLLVVSTPYHGYLKNLVLSVTGKWDAHWHVHLDGGHVKFFSRRTLTAMLHERGFTDVRFHGAGRAPFLWKSMVVTARPTSDSKDVVT